MKKDGEFRDNLFRTMDECKEKMGQVANAVFVIVSIIYALLFWHFSKVAYTHWKRHGQGFRPQVDEAPGSEVDNI